MGSHSGVRIALIVATLVFYAITLFISYLSSSEFGRDIGWFKNNTGDVSDVFILIITPASWTYTIWGFIYTWQALWLIYAQTKHGWFKNNTGDVSDVFILIITPAGWTFTIWGFIYTWQALWLMYAQTKHGWFKNNTGDVSDVFILIITPAGWTFTIWGFTPGWFKNNTGDVSDVFILIITPAGWTFTIWGFIYTWQALWLIYAQTTICRTNNDGTPVYMLPQHSSIVYIFFMLNNAFIITWTFLWDRQHVGWACIAIVFTPLTLYVCLFVSHRRLYNSLTILRSGGLTKEIWLIRGLIQNGIAFFATWVTIATLLNFAMVLHYVWDVKMETSCIVSLALLGAIILKWFIVETFIFDKYVRYTMSPYIVLILGLAGSLSKNFDLDKNYTTSIMTVVLISASALLAIVKVFVVVYRHRKYPIKGTASDGVKGTLA